MKKRYGVTPTDIDRWMSAGLGQGAGPDYRPWLTTRDVSSRGRKSRPWGITTGRIHHLLSDNERHFFQYSDFEARVIDIREQFPLFPQADVIRIAEATGIRHPRYTGSTTPVVMTTDFLLTVRDARGGTGYRAVAVKSSADLSAPSAKRKRVLEKLELERRYWLARGVAWRVVTERQFDRSRLTNLSWLANLARLDGHRALLQRVPDFLRFVRQSWCNTTPLKSLFIEAAAVLGLPSFHDADRLFRHCVWHHYLTVDLGTLLAPRLPATVLHVSVPRENQHVIALCA